MNLKPQDVVVALKLCGYPNRRPPISVVAADLVLSPSEVHGAIQRLRTSEIVASNDLPPVHSVDINAFTRVSLLQTLDQRSGGPLNCGSPSAVVSSRSVC